MKKVKPLGKLSPWVWSVEFVRGCNLKCWHCTAPLIVEHDKPQFMTLETWESMCKVMAEITPYCRLELAQGGEPTLHPHLLECLKIAKKITPTTQIQVTTNGMTLLSNKITFKELFDAGANSVYVDMYSTIDKFIPLINEAGENVEWYKYDKPKEIASNINHRMANTYYGDPNMKLIILQDHPEERWRWRKQGRLSTFLNHLNWDITIPYGLVPVRESYQRKCTLPMRYSSLTVDGDYIFCCIDFWGETAGLLGNVSQGAEGFKNYWFGRLVQSIRRHLRTGDRRYIPYCSRCNCAFSKCDLVNMWSEEAYQTYLKDGKREDLPLIEKDYEIFSNGWGWHEKMQNALPSLEDEQFILDNSKKIILHSDKTVRVEKDEEITKQLNLFFRENLDES